MNGDRAKSTIINRLLRSTVSNYIGRFVGLVTWILLTPFILHQLDQSLFGLWVLVGSVVAFGSLLDFGIAGAVTKYVSEYQAQGQIDQAKKLIATALYLYFALGLVVILASIAIAPIFPRLFNVSAEHKETAVWLVLLSGLGMGLAIPSTSTKAVLSGLQRFDLMNLLSVITTLLSAGFTVIVLLSGGGVIGLVSVTIAVNLLVQIPAIRFIHRIAPELHFGLARPSRKMLWTVTSFSSSLFLVHVGGQLETKTDEIVIGAFLPVNAVTPYNLARKLSTLPQLMAEQFLSLLLPLASELHAENNRGRLRSLYIISTRVTLGTFLAIGISLVVLAGPILTIWIGEEFAKYADLVFILTLASFIDIPTWPAGFVLQGIGRHRFTAVMALCSGIANLILSLILVQHLGLTGVALGTLIPTAIICLGFILPYAIRIIGVTVQQMYKYVFLPVFVPVIPAGLVTYLLRELFAPASILLTLLIAAAGSLVYLTLYLRAESCEFEKTLFRDMVAKMFSYARNIRKGSKEGGY